MSELMEENMVRIIKNLSLKVRRKILHTLNENKRAALVLQRNGDVRVYDLGKYEGHKHRMGQLIRAYKPWVKRQKSLLGPIGGRKLGIKTKLSRVNIYEAR